VFAAGLLAVFFVLYLLIAGLPQATIGDLALLAYGMAIGCLGIAPWIIRVMIRTKTYQNMDRPNAWACCGGVCFSAAVFSFGALLLINAPGKQVRSFKSDFTVIAKVHGTGRQKQSCHLDIFSSTYGWRQISTQEDFWDEMRVGEKMTLFLQSGRLGYPVITGYERQGGAVFHPLRGHQPAQ
jgi:hypothetical protein